MQHDEIQIRSDHHYYHSHPVPTGEVKAYRITRMRNFWGKLKKRVLTIFSVCGRGDDGSPLLLLLQCAA
jgi:hypothetical protein